MKNVLEWLESTAQRVPGKTAFADADSWMTFAELHAQAQTIGAALAECTAPRSAVAIMAEKTPAAISAMLGTVYARCCYCVLDDRQPEARLASILETLGPMAVVADAAHLEAAQALCEAAGVPVLALEQLAAGPFGNAQAAALGALRQAALDIDPLYVTFTSGSTGTPKGVVTAHRSVIDFITAFSDTIGIGENDVLANQAPLDFDGASKDIYSCLRTGATVNLVPRDFFSTPAQLMDYLVQREVTLCIWAVSALCFVSIMGGFDYAVPRTIRGVCFTGEIMPVKHLNVWRAHLPEAFFVNLYGPTESTCNCTYFLVDRAYENDETIPMGKAFPNESVFLLDEGSALIASDRAGVQGEICVAGTTLALGYCNDPDKTAAAFVQSPLAPSWPETMYRTGDLAVYNENGDLVFQGRKDHQIKLFGQRIELGEIETVAQALDGVARACCIYNERKQRILMYYEGAAERDAVSKALREKLPSYMVPNKITQLEHLPVTKNGKIDRGALAAK